MSILYYAIFNAGYNLATNEISRLLYTKTSFCVDTLEEEIARIQKLQNECLNDDILYYTSGAFHIMTKSEQTQRLLEMHNRLEILHESSTYIDEVFVYIPGLNRKVSSLDGVELIANNIAEKNRMNTMLEKSKYSSLFYDQGSMYLGVSYPYSTISESTTPNFTLLVRLSNSRLKEPLNFLSEYADSGIKLSDCSSEYELYVGENINLDEVTNTENQSLQKVTDPATKQEYMVFKISSVFLNMDLYSYISSKTVYQELNLYRTVFFSCLAIVLFLMACYLYSMYVFISKPIKTLVSTIEQMEKGDLSVRIFEKREDEFRQVYDAFNRMAESLQNQMEINYRQKILTQQAELRHLQSQINPHFLYNSFFSIYRMAKDEDCESIVELSSYLSEYYRYITKSAQRDTELKAEVTHARQYAQIQAMRFKRRLSVSFKDLPAAYEDLPVPRLILQPLLENALEHGLKNVEKGGLLQIWYEQQDQKLFIHVQDNGSGMSKAELSSLKESFSQTSETIEDGLSNINRRLRIKFGEPYGIQIRSEEGMGTICSLVLPLKLEKEENDDVQSTGS